LIKEPTKERERNFKCDQCNYAGTDKYKLKSHYRVHRGHKRRKHKVNLDDTEYHDNAKITILQCEFCDFQTCKGKRALQNHIMMVHTFEKPFECHLCDYKSVLKQSLKKHISRVHNKSCDFKCPFCDHVTTDKDYLRAHMRTHETEEDSTKKWLCEICCKRFRDKCKLRNGAFKIRYYSIIIIPVWNKDLQNLGQTLWGLMTFLQASLQRTYEYSHWWKALSMRHVWLCMCSSSKSSFTQEKPS